MATLELLSRVDCGDDEGQKRTKKGVGLVREECDARYCVQQLLRIRPYLGPGHQLEDYFAVPPRIQLSTLCLPGHA